MNNLKRGQPDTALRAILFASVLCCCVIGDLRAVGTDPDKVTDLTSLSLEQLYNLDVVQINVLGGHTHPAGQIMFGYQYMLMNMEGIKQGEREISPEEAMAQGFATVHTKMTMQMHMFDVMYAPIDRLTLMAMLPYKQMSMNHLMGAGLVPFTQHADGIGDLEVMALYTLLGDIKKGQNRLLLNAGVSFPTGSVTTSDHRMGDPSMPMVRLEYPMQLGSGTYDLLPGLTYLGDANKFSYGAQAIATVRLGRNDSGYRFGNQYRLTTWGAYALTDWLAPYLRLDGRWWENVTGADPLLATNPTAEGKPDRQAGRRVDLLFGLGLYAPKGSLKGARLSVEGGFPLYEHLTGPQLGTSWLLTMGVSYAF